MYLKLCHFVISHSVDFVPKVKMVMTTLITHICIFTLGPAAPTAPFRPAGPAPP